ncbi:hypothetical protein PI125_g7495 [Phytophthora idaei]|nr:hypothetical protein PI125_g7495 [Phytophthora idaei]
MHATADALNELARATRTYDKKNLKSKGITGVVTFLIGGKKQSKKESKMSKDTDPVGMDNNRVGSEGILRAPDTVEEVVTSTLSDCFSGFMELQHQIATSEKSLSPLFAEGTNDPTECGS